MKLVQHNKFEPVRILDDRPVKGILTRHQEFEHHKIREEDIGLCLSNALSLFGSLLAGVTIKRGTQVGRQFRLFDELLQFLHLTVGESVHWINDNRARPLRLAGSPGTDSRIYDRDEEAEGLARTGAGCNDEALAPN